MLGPWQGINRFGDQSCYVRQVAILGELQGLLQLQLEQLLLIYGPAGRGHDLAKRENWIGRNGANALAAGRMRHFGERDLNSGRHTTGFAAPPGRPRIAGPPTIEPNTPSAVPTHFCGFEQGQ